MKLHGRVHRAEKSEHTVALVEINQKRESPDGGQQTDGNALLNTLHLLGSILKADYHVHAG